MRPLRRRRAAELEDAILSRARQLRIASSEANVRSCGQPSPSQR